MPFQITLPSEVYEFLLSTIFLNTGVNILINFGQSNGCEVASLCFFKDI